MTFYFNCHKILSEPCKLFHKEDRMVKLLNELQQNFPALVGLAAIQNR